MHIRTEIDRPIWFSMWFLASIATFGLAFFPLFYRLVENRNEHFRRQVDFENQIVEFFRKQGKELQRRVGSFEKMNARVWAASIVFVIPAFAITYLLSRDLRIHEKSQEVFLANAFPRMVFMPQTIAIRKYVFITIVTLGLGIVYWLYKIINMYNAHFKAQREIEKEIFRLMEEARIDQPV